MDDNSIQRGVRRGWVWATVVLIVAAASLIRLKDVQAWRAHPNRGFLHDGRPVLIEFDGYHYLRAARDLAEGNYEPKSVS